MVCVELSVQYILSDLLWGVGNIVLPFNPSHRFQAHPCHQPIDALPVVCRLQGFVDRIAHLTIAIDAVRFDIDFGNRTGHYIILCFSVGDGTFPILIISLS